MLKFSLNTICNFIFVSIMISAGLLIIALGSGNVRAKPTDPASLTVIVGDSCVSDASSQLDAAMQSGSKDVVIVGCLRLSHTLIVPPNVVLQGRGTTFPNPMTPQQTQLRCDANVTPCLHVGNGTNASAHIMNLVVNRVPTSTPPPADSVGIDIDAGQEIILENVMSYNHGICFQLNSNPAKGAGISFHGTRLFTGRCSTTHLDINGWAEVRISQARFGTNGLGDLPAQSYMRIRGGTHANLASGPNTIEITDSQFNQGVSAAKDFVDFVNRSSGGFDSTDFNFNNNHVEAVSDVFFHSDASWYDIRRMVMTGNVFNSPPARFFDLSSSTMLKDWNLVSNAIFARDFTLAPANGLQGFVWTGGLMTGPCNLTGTQNSTVFLSGTVHNQGCTLKGDWGKFISVGQLFRDGNFISHAHGNIVLIGDK